VNFRRLVQLCVPIAALSSMFGGCAAVAVRPEGELPKPLVVPTPAKVGVVVTTETSNTLADGMATRIPDPDALSIIRKGASHIVQVTDEEVAAAVRAYWTDTHNLAEGAGAAPLAAALQEKARLAGKHVGLILSGGNIDFDLFRNWIAPEAAVVRRMAV